jgi:hypothetical protein
LQTSSSPLPLVIVDHRHGDHEHDAARIDYGRRPRTSSL